MTAEETISKRVNALVAYFRRKLEDRAGEPLIQGSPQPQSVLCGDPIIDQYGGHADRLAFNQYKRRVGDQNKEPTIGDGLQGIQDCAGLLAKATELVMRKAIECA